MARKVSEQIINAFYSGRKLKVGNTETDGKTVWLHGNPIITKEKGRLLITISGWNTPTTRERLNAIPGVKVHVKDYSLYLNGKRWDGNWTDIGSV